MWTSTVVICKTTFFTHFLFVLAWGTHPQSLSTFDTLCITRVSANKVWTMLTKPV